MAQAHTPVWLWMGWDRMDGLYNLDCCNYYSSEICAKGGVPIIKMEI